MGIRSFLAFELPPEIRDVVRRTSDDFRKTPADVRWVKAENIHLTVVFLGHIEERVIEKIGHAAETLCRGYGALDIAIEGVGFFPDMRRPRVLWLGLAGDLERMSFFRDSLQRDLTPFGIKEEKRPFRPHLTLGRFKTPQRITGVLEERLLEHRDLTSPVCPLRELTLFKSTLKPGGAVYSKLATWPLSGDQ
jgi:2'-5' RNA ligase